MIKVLIIISSSSSSSLSVSSIILVVLSLRLVLLLSIRPINIVLSIGVFIGMSIIIATTVTIIPTRSSLGTPPGTRHPAANRFRPRTSTRRAGREALFLGFDTHSRTKPVRV